jgi:hypothetical protein
MKFSLLRHRLALIGAGFALIRAFYAVIVFEHSAVRSAFFTDRGT